jgi:hypothetical protein
MKDLNGLKKLLLLFSVNILLFASNELADDILSNNQKALIVTQKAKAEIESNKLKNSWINPIIVQYSRNYSNQFDNVVDTGQFIISIDQPIFKMGGIWEAIKYAQVLGEVNSIDIEIQKRELIQKALSILFNLQKLKLQIEKLNLLIKNDELDILIQRESYEAGIANRTLLDKALLKRNQDITSKLELEMQIIKLRNDFSLLSDSSPEDIRLPYFTIIDRNRYEEKQLELKRDRLHLQKTKHYKFMTVTKYLPEISITGRYINEDKNPLFAHSKIKTEYYNYGFKVSLPININSYKDIETSKIDYLNARIALNERKKRVINEYNLIKKRLEIIDQKIALSIDDATNYESMLNVAKGLEKVGDSTNYDTEIIENNLKIRLLDQEIYRYDAQLELLTLYVKVADSL